MSITPEEAKLQMMTHSVEEGLKTIVRALVSAGLQPIQAIELVEERIASVRKTVEMAIERSETP